MLAEPLLVDLLSKSDISRKDKIYLILATKPDASFPVSHIIKLGVSAGLREIENWNVSRMLAESKGIVVRVPSGWVLTSDGKQHILSKFLQNFVTSPKKSALRLRSYLDNISNTETREFVEESIKCLEADLHRSAVVMSWAGAISILYDYVILNRLGDFNATAPRYKREWKPAVTKDDLAQMNESKFLEILANLSIIGKNTKDQLQNSLKLRNSCAHPSSFRIGKHIVESHIEILILNVYEKI